MNSGQVFHRAEFHFAENSVQTWTVSHGTWLWQLRDFFAENLHFVLESNFVSKKKQSFLAVIFVLISWSCFNCRERKVGKPNRNYSAIVTSSTSHVS